MQKITPYLWFDNQAEEAANFYISIFKNSRILNVARLDSGGTGQEATAMIVNFQLEGQDFIALNGGPQFSFTPAISLYVDCTTQDEVDTLWAKLGEGGSEEMCGWLKDKYGLSWQIIPRILGELMQDKDPAKAQSVMQAMLKMQKIEIKALQDAYASA